MNRALAVVLTVKQKLRTRSVLDAKKRDRIKNVDLYHQFPPPDKRDAFPFLNSFLTDSRNESNRLFAESLDVEETISLVF